MQPCGSPVIQSKDLLYLKGISAKAEECLLRHIDGKPYIIVVSSPPLSETPFSAVFDEGDRSRIEAGKTGRCFIQQLPSLQQDGSCPFVKMLAGLGETGCKETAIAHVAKSSTRSVEKVTIITEDKISHQFVMVGKSDKYRIYNQRAEIVAKEKDQEKALIAAAKKCHSRATSCPPPSTTKPSAPLAPSV